MDTSLDSLLYFKYLPVESCKWKLTYAEILNASIAVDHQNKTIAANRLSIAAPKISWTMAY